MRGEALIIKRSCYLTAHNPSRWRRSPVEVNCDGNPGRIQHVLRPGARVLYGPFRPGEAVSYSGHDRVSFEFVDVPGDTPR